MKKIVVLLSIALLLFSCHKKEDRTSPPSTPRIISPHSHSEEIQESESDFLDEEEQRFLVPMISLPPEETILVTNDVNLDFDTEDEQIILTHKMIEENTRINLYVVDYDNDKMAFYTVLKTVITPNNTEGISILIQDLTGNNLNEIIITGFTTEQNHTLDAFTITSSGGINGLLLKPILGLSINGIIDMQTYDRSQDYKMGKTTNESFSIVTEETDATSEDNLDLIKTSYKWDNIAKKYIPSSIDKIPGVSIKEEKLEKIYKGTLDEFVDYISGPWYRVEDLSRKKQALLEEIILFHPEDNQIVFSVDDIQEIYNWNDTFRTIFKGINIQSRNSLISSQRKDIYLSLEELDRIKVNIHGSTEWDGYYKPVDSILQKSLMPDSGIEESKTLSRLSGQFRNNKGEDLNLELPYFTLKSGTENIAKGVIEFYILNNISIMEMRHLKENGLMEKREIYSVEYNESTDSSRIIRTLTLTPGILSTKGFTQEPGEALHYEQIEVSDSATAEES